MYFLPGGGVKKGEILKDAAVRELKEETNLDLKDVSLLAVFQNRFESKHDTVVIFLSKRVENIERLHPDKVEVVEAKFFDINNLPKNVSAGTKCVIDAYVKKTYPVCGVWN